MTSPSATSCRWHHTNTSWNHGYKGIAENGRAGSHLVPMILQWPPKKKVPKGRRGQEFQVHTYPTVSSRPRGRCVQSLVQIGSEMWICISFIHTYKQTFIFIYKISNLINLLRVKVTFFKMNKVVSVGLSRTPFQPQPWQRPVTTWVYKPEAANTVWSSWWWAVCRSKHVEPSINFEIINYITRLHLVGYFYWFTLRCTDPWILNLKPRKSVTPMHIHNVWPPQPGPF